MKRANYVAGLIAGLALLAPVSAFAMVDELDEPGETTLQTVQSKFDIRIAGADNAGNSVRVEVRPRDGNCVTGNAYKVTMVGASSIDGAFPGTPTNVDENPALHDNPMCEDSKWGYFSVNRWSDSEHTVAYTLHGTLKSYTIEVTFSDIRSGGKSKVIKLRSN